MKMSQEINEIAAALAKSQSEMKGAEKNGVNGHLKSRYFTIDSIWHSAIPITSRNGIFVSQDATCNERGVCIETFLFHASGQWMSFGPFFIPYTKNDAQGYGAATTYAKKYALAAALGIVEEEEASQDDDGNSISEPAKDEPLLSQKQHDYILSLIKSFNDPEMEKRICDGLKVESIASLSISKAKDLIEMLKKKQEGSHATRK